MGRVPVQPERLTISLTGRALTIACRAAARASRPATASAGRFDEVTAWDRAGRLYSVWRDDRTARRGLDGRVRVKWRETGEARRAWLETSDADALVDRAAAIALEVLQHTGDGETRRVLGRAAAFDAAAAATDAGRFAAVYSHVGILPPDQYLATIVQATEGCSIRTCRFCDLFDRPYRVKPIEEFRAHAALVREYMGDSLRLRGRSVFLGAANALALPARRLEPCFEILRQIFGLPVTGFVDGRAGAVKSIDEYRRLRALGLRRVYVGLESGHDPLLELVRKPSRARETIEAVRAMKAARLGVAVIVMLGLGGEQHDPAHVADTIAVLNQMPLGSGDLIYFSDLVAAPGSRYAELARAAGIVRLDRLARRRQKDRIRAGLRFNDALPQIATYDIREFVY